MTGNFVVLDKGSEKQRIECGGVIVVLLDWAGSLAVCTSGDEDANDGQRAGNDGKL